MKKYTFYILLVTILFGAEAQSQWRPYGVPEYIKAEYFENFPNFYQYPINGRLRHFPTPPEDLKYVPEQTRFLSSDGIEIVNASSSFPDAKTETWMAINPLDPNNLIATSNDNRFLGGFQGFRMSAFVTKDGGRNWVHSPTPANSGHWITPQGSRATIFDPGITYDHEGNVYYIYGFSETTWGSDDKDTEKNGVFVVKSTDGGSSWNALEEYGINGIVAITNDAFQSSDNPFHDRYSVGADWSETSPHQGNIYVTWRVFRGMNGVVFSRSTNGGNTWSSYRRLALGGQAPQPVTGPDGDVYVTWIDVDMNGNSRAMFIRSTDAGNSFGNPIEAQRIASIGNRHPSSGRFVLTDKQDIRVSSVPQMAVDISQSPNRGTIYIVQAGRETSNGPYGVYLAKSTNNGLSWEKNIRIDNSINRRDMFFPSISCDPKTGMVAVLYYSSQNDDDNVGVDAYVAISQDGGNTWRHLRVTPSTFYLNQRSTVFPQGGEGNIYWGDYTHIVAFDNKVYPLFWMPTRADYAYQTNALFTAFISPAPQPPIDVAFETQLSPTRLRLNWIHPTKTLLGDDLTEFKINIYKGETNIGEVQHNQTAEFIDSDVVYGSSYTYFLETEMPNGLKSAKVEINAIAGGNPKPKPPTELAWRPHPNGVTFTWRNPRQTVADEPLLDNLKIAFYNAATNQLIESVGSSEFTAGSVNSHTVVMDTEKFYKIRIKAVTVRGNVETESDFSADEIIAYSGAPKSDIDENFDNTESIIPHYISDKWGLTTEKAKSEPNSLTDSPGSNYAANQYEYVILAPVVLSADKSTLSFDHIALIDTTVRFDVNNNPTYDFGDISYSRDFGKTWNMLKWVNSATSEEFFTGNLAGSQWQSLAFNLSQYTGDTVLFRFALGSNDFRQAEGWFIDNIKMDNRPSSVNYDLLEMTRLFVSPNPANNFARVSLTTVTNADLRIELYDLLGSKIDIRNVGMINQGEYSFDFKLSQLADGVYYFRISLDNYTKTIPVSVVR
ncbi:MAG: T9SS type A sorting domain-containing protein [Candidatus Kapabacteria bacterium]|nr:T9SS type A sorting domain-containing protein [Ignavibacteriota bacterium]MCW5886160.1 T9SS type A sorting domain-containing protein [Candidatus Kapabacteria bacterium]